MYSERYPWKVFAFLFGVGLLAWLLSLPLTLSLPFWLLALLIGVVWQAIVVGLGLWLAGQIGLGAPILAHWLTGQSARPRLRAVLVSSLLAGVGVGTLLLLMVLFVFLPLYRQSPYAAEVNMAVWQRVLLAFDAAILEELLFRLFLFSLFVWLMTKVRRQPAGLPGLRLLWMANVIVALLFGLAHLPAKTLSMSVTLLLVSVTLMLNGIGSITFGYLYWKRGLEAAILAHFCADLILHGIGPMLFSLSY